MEDFMDSLVKEVEGNMKPIRAERMDDPFDTPSQPNIPYQQPVGQPAFRTQPQIQQSIPQPAPVYQAPPPMPIYQQPQAAPIYQMPPVMQPQPQPIYRDIPQAAPEPVAESGPVKQEAPKAGTIGNSVSKDKIEEVEKDLFLHVHRENVKCYRNMQATMIENTNMVKQGLEDKHTDVHKWLLILLVLSLVNLGANALLILHMIFGFL